MHKFLVIQTAFTGDVVLATAIVEKLHLHFPDARIDFLLRKGNESLLLGHPYITEVIVWNKGKHKKRNLLRIAMQVRREHYTHIVNIHRFTTSGFITFLSRAGHTAGFDKNPFSFSYNKKVAHVLSKPYMPNPVHEITRNQELIADITDTTPCLPRLYPSAADIEAVQQYQAGQYICIAPSSVWFTKQFPAHKWIELINQLPQQYTVYLLGGPGDKPLGDTITAGTLHKDVHNLGGMLSYLQSAALMKGAVMNYSNDSAPLHFASAMDAPVTAVFCSTVPAFGFGPLHPNARVVEIAETLYCRPCGLHGHKACPQGHFRCANDITNDQLLWWTSKTI
ncbi:MAG: glycosyltransferase family 9 protein [Bacteroidota bacterium]